jgi:glutathione peroxidase
VTHRTVPLLATALSALTLASLATVPGIASADEPRVATAEACPQLLDREFSRLQTGKSESLCQYRGKVLLIVNTASYCGYTHQYEGLEALYRKYKDRGLVVLGFPSNDFEQEPGSNKEIAEFCRLTYGVEFPMFEKSSVKSLRANPLFADLSARTGQGPKWNFQKYVIDRNGNPAGTFASRVEPNDRELIALLEKLLADKPATPKG